MDYLTYKILAYFILCLFLLLAYITMLRYILNFKEEERYKLNALNNKDLEKEIINIRGDLAQHILFGLHKGVKNEKNNKKR